MQKNKNYSFNQIQKFADEYDFLLTELGGKTVGTSFITLEHRNKDYTISFVLESWMESAGNQYTCIYSGYN